ncbi:PAB-dependent poly(A)-specific ribonuclease subunit PAN2 [Xylariaceae sp. FL0255]|nr:PAB-dependent poly(A)-specific ribonuclease subunit PAN2 [Xylariaceae sp. FL0255]
MEGDWDEVARIQFPPPGPQAPLSPVACLAFDSHQELLWTGNEYGRVTSFYSNKLHQYTSWKDYSNQDGPVLQIIVNERGVISLGARGVRMRSRRGIILWSIRTEDMKELRCMSFTSKARSEILVAGEQDKMLIIDTVKGEITRQEPVMRKYKIMRRTGRRICLATTSGAVDIIDSISFQLVKTWVAHSAEINDMDARHDYIVTCGYSQRQQGLYPDPFVNVFDLKKMASHAPLSFPAGAAYVRMHPRLITTSIVMSQIGQMHIVDMLNPNAINVRQTQAYRVSKFEIAQSAEAIVLADGEYYNIHLWGSANKIQSQFNELTQPIEAPTDTGSVPVPNIPFDALDIPLSSVGMPYYREVLLSAWPSNAVTEVGAPPVKLDAPFVNTLTKREWGWFGKNTRPYRRNQVEDTRGSESLEKTLRPPKFLSEKARELAKSPAGTPAPEEIVPEFPQVLQDSKVEGNNNEVPAHYMPVEIKYSKFGIDDFDFGFFNKTGYSGLLNHIVNTYANSLFQIMHYTPLIRNIALQHTATTCYDEQCMLCELGYLFDMLYKAKGEACQASNLLKTLSYIQESAVLGILEDRPHNGTRTMMLQQLTRVLLKRMSINYNSMIQYAGQGPGPFEQLFQTSAVNCIKCTSCRNETRKEDNTMVNELIYPQNVGKAGSFPFAAGDRTANGKKKPGPRNNRVKTTTFSQILKMSVERDHTNKGWCLTCHRYQPLATKKTIRRVPNVLMLAAAVNHADHRRLWATPGWLPEEIGIIVDNGNFFCYEGEDLKLHLQRGMHNITVYSLTGLAVSIESGPQQLAHLVAMANIAQSLPEAPDSSQWYMFNDFLVKPISSKEALSFNTTWKTPSMITYQVKSANNRLDDSWKQNLDSQFLYIDTMQTDRPDKSYRVLDSKTESAGPDTVVAIDTEFVKIAQPEIEVHSDGKSNILRPMLHALARTSLVRGAGMHEGDPFIDDYITIKEEVVDYLTSYSGITPEDLAKDTALQRGHNLVPLKIAYKKIWILLNLGCKFLGHGLKQDFRVINIHVPKSQIIDTSDLFWIQAYRRKLSLQFLAHTVLKQDIQQITHDSIEDARIALKLYRKYQEWSEAGVLRTMMDEIYQKGMASNFRVPVKGTAGTVTTVAGAATPTLSGALPIRTDTPPVVGGDIATTTTTAGVGGGSGPRPTTPSKNTGSGGVAALTPGSTPYRESRLK